MSTKSINTKPKNDQDKSYSDRTNKQTNKQIERQTLRIIISTRASVVPVPSPIMIKSHIMTKNQYPSLDQYIYHRYIYISRPPPR